MTSLNHKHERVKDLIKDLDSVVIAFSGGVDSSLVAKIAKDTLDNVIAVTIDSKIVSRNEIKHAKDMANEIGIKHQIVKLDLLGDENFVKNPLDRCYFCKKRIVETLNGIRNEYGFRYVVDGTNFDDLKDPGRYGLRALREGKVIRSPLAEVGIKKREVRELAKELGLSNAKRRSVSCMATRIPTNEQITLEKLRKIEQASLNE